MPETKEVHISTIKIGDTVLHNGELRTVGKESFNRSEFMGVSIFGDCYRLGTKKVTLVKFR